MYRNLHSRLSVGAAEGCDLLILFLKNQSQKIAAFGSSYKNRAQQKIVAHGGVIRGWKGKSGASACAYAVFYQFRAIKLTKWVARGGYFPVSVLVLPGLTRSHCVKRAISICQVEPNPDFGIYNPTRRGYRRGCQIQKIGLDG
ncbi:hypothetical protein LOY52_04925 [Pseudomonas sp. B21-051]|uniref:hypothetical protein n=1 Tax=Pseudomonas sp. B21-051 TaxID=2895491 RepID=UPI00215ECCBC|nr:hypothetical protein [Pseudomonas sp. B21-051]UVK89416.1 hypothetical protein LOY52_04925 [Pseudomonas sp. B21-051]